MSTNVIILCQGSQSRLPTLTCAKQMLPLAACGGMPILARTWEQLNRLSANSHLTVQIVAWQPLIEAFLRGPQHFPVCRTSLGFLTLPEPGNSSLKGVAAALARRSAIYDQTVILLGDVVYSWDTLRTALWNTKVSFLGTPDLSPSGGELFAVRWNAAAEATMLAWLDGALAAHPKFKEYQPGQMRLWLTGGHDWNHAIPMPISEWTSYHSVTDYTDDIDLPADVTNLPALSVLAAADDAANGVTW